LWCKKKEEEREKGYHTIKIIKKFFLQRVRAHVYLSSRRKKKKKKEKRKKKKGRR